MSAAVVVRNAYKTYKNLSAPLKMRSYRSSGALTVGAAGKSGLLDQLPVVVAIDRVSFTVEEGQIFGLIGPNGSGKSTLLRLLATLLPLDDGQIQIYGLDAARQPLQVRRLINPIAGEASFFKKLSPLENLARDGRQYGLDEAETRWQAMDILTCLGMQKRFIHTPMDGLSNGMQQMVALARAILSRPRLLLLDEPSAGLDPFVRRQLHALLADLQRQLGTTIVFATQDLEEAELLCNRVAILDHGQIIALDTPAALRGSPATSLEDAFLDLVRPQSFALEAEIA
jgi:ABC-2 type transport system ATP-binding protein